MRLGQVLGVALCRSAYVEVPRIFRFRNKSDGEGDVLGVILATEICRESVEALSVLLS